jgi:hypothetical protein
MSLIRAILLRTLYSEHDCISQTAFTYMYGGMNYWVLEDVIGLP